MEIVGQEFMDQLLEIWQSWIPALPVVRRALNQRFSIHSTGEIIVLESLCPWIVIEKLLFFFLNFK